MARIFMDGFESGDFGLWIGGSATVAIDSSRTGRTGTYCMYLPSGCTGKILVLPAATEYYFAFKFNLATFSSYPYFYVMNAAGKSILRLDMGNGVFTRGDDSGAITQYATASNYPITAGTTWHLVEFYLKVHTSSGRLVFKINEITLTDFTGDTQDVTDGNITQFFMNGTSSSIMYIDDVIVDNANWIGPSSIQGLAVTGAGATTQFDPSTGNNYDCVNEIPPSDADYISTNVANEVDTYACGDLTGTINSVKAVQVQARCMQEGSPAVPKIQLVTRPSSTDRVSASKDVQTFAPGIASNIWELNPEDSAAWEEADVNGMEIGVKAVAS